MDRLAIDAANAVAAPAKSFLISALGYVVSSDGYLKSLKDEVDKLQERAEEVKKDVEDAERRDLTATGGVESWQRKVEQLQADATKMMDKYDDMCTCLGDCRLNVVSRYQISTKAEELTGLAKKLYETVPKISRSFDPDQFVPRLCICLEGRDSMLQQLQQIALDDSESIIGICGMAGVGKTELLNKFYNYFSERTHYQYRMIWVDMKNCHSVEETQRVISERLELRWNKDDKQEVRANRILRYLNKKFFIMILDDVWSAVNLKDVGIPLATHQEKSKVILATRREDVCDTMEAAKVQVKCLEWEEAWRLFVNKAGKRLIESEPEIQHQAEVLVKKCGGLPLALVTIGHAMARKRTRDLWKHAVTTLENTPQQIRGMKDVLSCLKRSYDNLADDKLRTCLLYCTLFPEGHNIPKNWIVDYCIGEGVLVDRFYDGDHVYNEGYNLLDILMSASMLEPGPNSDYMKMHPMIRVLALWIERGTEENKCLIRAGKGLAEAPDIDDWTGIERISLMHNNIERLSERPDCPSLLTLMLNNNPLVKICDKFFRSMKNLRVLDLSHTCIQKVPAEIGELVQLQYLDFCNTKIASLPVELGNLVGLRYSLLSHTTNLKSIPEGLIKKFSKLRVLYMESSYEDWKVDSVGKGVDFEEFHFLKRLKALGISVNTAAALRKLAGSNQLANSTCNLDIRLSHGLRSTLSTATLGNKFKALKRLQIRECSDLEELSIDGRHQGSLPNLTDLALLRLPAAKITWNGGRLQNLRFLAIVSCREMRQLIHCDDESIEEDDERLREINVLPNLCELLLFNLPELESLSCGGRPMAFNSLEVLRVVNCPKLKKLPLHVELRCIYGQVSWWNGLEWPEDHDNIKSKFQPIFKEYTQLDSHAEMPATDGLVMVEKNSAFEQLQQLAVDDRVSIIGVHGMAGVGKTRLLQRFFKQFHLRRDYKMVWIDIDGNHNVQETQKAVAEKLGFAGYQNKSQEDLAVRICKFLNGKKFILIFDNVWKVVDLNGIGIPSMTCHTKSKVILSTQKEDVCDSMNAIKVLVKCLEQDEAWGLFVEKASQELIESHTMIQCHATSLVKKCGGLPLALVTIGRAMAKKRTPEKWEDAVTSLENKPLQIGGMKDVLSCLKHSYDNLPDDKLRACLLYCSLYPEDYAIKHQVITNHFIGEGLLVDDFCDGIKMYDEGRKFLDFLKAASLLGAGPAGDRSDSVKMHPMICVLALSIAGEKWLIRARKGLTEAPDVAEWRRAERISLMGNKINKLSGRPDSPSLLTLLLRENPIVEICNGFFQYLKNLRVLDLSYTSLQEVPEEIGDLIELQYLNLSGTRISSLPKELAKLIRLRLFGLADTSSLVKIPAGLIASLTDLRVLPMCGSYKDWKLDSTGDGVGFEEIHSLKQLKVLGISVNSALALRKLAGSLRLASSTHDLEISLSHDLTTLSTATLGSDFKALKLLRLLRCNDLEELEIVDGDSAWLSTLPRLTCIQLFELPTAKLTWNSGSLQSLKVLQIANCGGMKQLIHCDVTKQDDEEQEKGMLEEINVLPNLQQLDLANLQELESLSCGNRPMAFYSLEIIHVNDCPKLKKLPLNADKLECIYGQASWWNELEWTEDEDDNIKSKFKSIFVETFL